MNKQISNQALNRMLCILFGVILLCGNLIVRYNRQSYYTFFSVALPLVVGLGVFIPMKDKKKQIKEIVLLALFVCSGIVMLLIMNP